MFFIVNDVQIPVRLEITDSTWNINNADETITLKPHYYAADSFSVEMPLFHTQLIGKIQTDTTLNGIWIDPTRVPKSSITFSVKPNHQPYQDVATLGTESIYDCQFSPDQPENQSHAVGILKTYGGQIHATFLTETGDYRFLEGNTTGQSIELSCFDGTHLFYFCANIKGDSLTDGHFVSGSTWQEKWSGYLHPSAQLRDPDSLTTFVSKENFAFTALDQSQQKILFDSTRFKDHVTIVQILGSWCPNCTDESKFLKDLYAAYNNKGLQIIPVAFEREATVEDQLFRVQRQFQDLEIPYPPYLGGTSPKSKAEQVFPQLNHIISYPTTIILDKKGKVRKIHTGFYGPGTGKYYMHHKELLTMFVEALLDEH
jgi:thiol-disulfide isomerase/thioredoxin